LKKSFGGTAKLVDPQGPLTTALEGINNSQLAIPLAATLDSAELAADHIELCWQALPRDVPGCLTWCVLVLISS
jgi:hypothetical protein